MIPVVFNLELEDGEYGNVPEFYLYAVTDVNDRTTYKVNGMRAVLVV